MIVNLPQSLLQKVTKPARYTGGEYNAVYKDWDGTAVKFALSLPDIYEVGMSNLGLAILYEVLNNRADTLCERIYAPATDMEEFMRKAELPLFSLETHHGAADFDVWGFSLQYEMIYTNVLNMLDLAGVSLWSAERREDEPLIVGGGPCVYNAEPMADFFDAFVVGEGEEAIGEMAETVARWKKANRPDGRKGLLLRLAHLDGIYVPSLYQAAYHGDGKFAALTPKRADIKPQILKRLNTDMDKAPALTRPLVPYVEIVHNRLMLELFRGCSRGCRFCQAGICYRPVRERTPERLEKLAERMALATGYDEMSLTSLSSADYSCLIELTERLFKRLPGKINLSLPSLRIDSFSVDLAQKLRQTRKSGLTFAPEAGTQRLRDVINKGVTEEDLLSACRAAFKQGWQRVKLYFMLGLPTETEADIIGIADLAAKVVRLYREVTGKGGVKVTVSVSCFVPKPYTPFQWFGQVAAEEFKRRQQILKNHITDRAITFNYHDATLSALEGVLARGDRRLARVIYQAWQNGAKFDGWSDLFKPSAWEEAFGQTGIDPSQYNERQRDFGEPLPWAVTSPGVSTDFLLAEWKKAMQGELTADCRRAKCNDCGICPRLNAKVTDYAAKSPLRDLGESGVIQSDGSLPPTAEPELYFYRAELTKGETIAFISHLEYAALIAKAMLRARLPVAYSSGFHPHMRISLAQALSCGVTSRAEYLDFVLTENLPPPEVIRKLNTALPPAAQIIRLRTISKNTISLTAACRAAVYDVTVPCTAAPSEVYNAVNKFNAAAEVLFTRVTPKKTRTKNIKDYLSAPLNVSLSDNVFSFTVKIAAAPDGSIKPSEILSCLVADFGLPVAANEAKICRTALCGANDVPLFEVS